MRDTDEIFEEKVTITLGKEAALILFDLLFDLRAQSTVTIDEVAREQAEVCALILLHGELESRLVESFSPSYKDLLELAKARIQARFGV